MNPFAYLRRRKILKALAGLVKTAKKLLGKPLDVRPKHREALAAALEEGERALADADADLEVLEKAGERLADGIYDSSFSHHVMSPRWKSSLELIALLLVALTIRAFLYEPFKIPTGSMKPTLLHGDHVFIRKFHYGPRWPFTTKRIWQGQAPARGDIVVFNNPVRIELDYIKRIVAVAGDRVKVVGGHLFVNDQPQPRRSLGSHTLLKTNEHTLKGTAIQAELYQEQSDEVAYYTLSGPPRPDQDQLMDQFYNDWPATYHRNPGYFSGRGAVFPNGDRGLKCRPDYCEVRDGFVFTMGDNRDDSSDSRWWGGVPLDYLRGKASVIWLSHDWTQPVIPMGPLTIGQLRWSRMFTSVDDLGRDLSAPGVKP